MLKNFESRHVTVLEMLENMKKRLEWCEREMATFPYDCRAWSPEVWDEAKILKKIINAAEWKEENE